MISPSGGSPRGLRGLLFPCRSSGLSYTRSFNIFELFLRLMVLWPVLIPALAPWLGLWLPARFTSLAPYESCFPLSAVIFPPSLGDAIKVVISTHTLNLICLINLLLIILNSFLCTE